MASVTVEVHLNLTHDTVQRLRKIAQVRGVTEEEIVEQALRAHKRITSAEWYTATSLYERLEDDLRA